MFYECNLRRGARGVGTLNRKVNCLPSIANTNTFNAKVNVPKMSFVPNLNLKQLKKNFQNGQFTQLRAKKNEHIKQWYIKFTCKFTRDDLHVRVELPTLVRLVCLHVLLLLYEVKVWGVGTHGYPPPLTRKFTRVTNSMYLYKSIVRVLRV